MNRRRGSVRRALSGWPCLFHLGRDAWCLRFSVVDLLRYQQHSSSLRKTAVVPGHRPFLRSTSPLVGVGCHKIAAYLHGVPCPFDAPAGRLLPIAGPIPRLRPSFRSPAANSIPSRFRLFSTPRVRRLPARPLRALPVPPVELVPSRRHPWDSSLQRSDCVLSRTPFGLPCPSFPWRVAFSCRHPDALRRSV